MRLRAALQGDLKKLMRQEFQNAERAVTQGVREATNGLKLAMRRQVTASGLGPRMANTWRGDIYPKGQSSIRAAGLVYTRASKVMAGFEEAKAIRSKDGFWLAIPTPNAPKRGVGGGRISPSNFPEQRFGPLRFIYRRNGPLLLVAENLRPSISRTTGEIRRFRKATTNRGVSSVVMFWLVPQVKTPKLLRFAEEAEKWYNWLPELILKNWP